MPLQFLFFFKEPLLLCSQFDVQKGYLHAVSGGNGLEEDHIVWKTIVYVIPPPASC